MLCKTSKTIDKGRKRQYLSLNLFFGTHPISILGCIQTFCIGMSSLDLRDQKKANLIKGEKKTSFQMFKILTNFANKKIMIRLHVRLKGLGK